MFKYYNHLGFHTKYYTKNDNKIYENFKQSLENIKEKKIDITSIIEFVNRFYFFADRTIIQDLYYTPWLAKLHDETWKYDNIDDFENNIKSEEEFMNLFLLNIEEEIIEYIGKSKKIGLLLSGGMDSRIVAAILNKLNKENKIKVDVTALTWGIKDSRDVIYSKKVCDLYKWNFKYFDLTPNILEKNIQITAENGCEYSPVHLHAMNEVSKVKGLDLILAGSFGDSMGRAEYSGKYVSDIKSIGENIVNKFYLVNTKLYKKFMPNVWLDLEEYYKKFPRKNKYSLYELERQAHYMRKELNSCMSIINKNIPLYQVFTSPKVYNLVLNTNLKFRNDNLYYMLLEKVDKNLLSIPWARTGKPYLKNSYQVNKYSKEYHLYGKWIKNDLSSIIENKINNGNIEKLNIFNMSSIRNMIDYNKRFGTERLNRIDELLIWLASLSDMIGMYNIEGVTIENKSLIEKASINILSKGQLFIYLNAIRYLK